MVNKLKDENKRLSDSLSQNNHISNSQNDQLSIEIKFFFSYQSTLTLSEKFIYEQPLAVLSCEF